MYTFEELQAKVDLAQRVGLSGTPMLDKNRDLARKVCNGIGADWMPEELREWISKLNPTLVLAADIHDLRYFIGGTECDRSYADREMLENGIKLANYMYRWYDPRRYWVRMKMKEFYVILEATGWVAFNYTDGTKK